MALKQKCIQTSNCKSLVKFLVITFTPHTGSYTQQNMPLTVCKTTVTLMNLYYNSLHGVHLSIKNAPNNFILHIFCMASSVFV